MTFFVGIAEQGEVEPVLRTKGLMLLRSVGRHADDADLQRAKRGKFVVELTGFLGAARRVVGRIEVQDDALSAEVLEANFVSPFWSFRVNAGARSPSERRVMSAPCVNLVDFA